MEATSENTKMEDTEASGDAVQPIKSTWAAAFNWMKTAGFTPQQEQEQQQEFLAKAGEKMEVDMRPLSRSEQEAEDRRKVLFKKPVDFGESRKTITANRQRAAKDLRLKQMRIQNGQSLQAGKVTAASRAVTAARRRADVVATSFFCFCRQ